MAKKKKATKHPAGKTPGKRGPGRPRTIPKPHLYDPMDLLTEDVIFVRDINKEFPKGSQPRRETTWRWAIKGVRGIKLESIRLGGKHLTSRQALTRFMAAIQKDE